MRIPIDVIELPHRTIHDPEAEFTYCPATSGDRENVPESDSVEIHEIYDAGAKVPYSEWVDQEEEIEMALLVELDKERG